ncbi:hypothetical protein CXB51_014517 [Gossypium anomalum]|uniref:Integrase catalytic domain-containing protein n=1 Tax=Gossypium anomalum TaxID=47600 RepID=A0A8J5YRM7_9ROSI|nr:hypothetical protein CXB51_014517 [Gossypium anomalum]
MLQEEGINPAGIAKGLVIQKLIAGLDQMCSVNAAKRWDMLKSDHEEQVFAVSCSATKEKATKGWLIDSGCTNHMTPDASIFKSIDKSFKTKVKVGNGHLIKVEGKGDVLRSTPTGNKLILNVLLVPEIEKNLLSIAQLLEKGYSVVFKGNECQISDPSGSRLISMDQLTKEDMVENFINSGEKEERLKGCKLKTLRTDNGIEYTSAQFQAFYDEVGIKHQLTNTYTPQRNGVSERKNRSLMDMTRCLMFEKNLPKTLWAEPSLAHLKVFGCICYAHVPAVKRDKLAKRAQSSILVGYNTVKKGYKILDPSTNKVLMSRDVVFDEKSCWNWEKNEPETVSEDLVADQTESDQNGPEMDIDDEPVRGTRPLAEIYERAQVAIVEQSSFEEAEAQQGWKQPMTDEISMIEKNQTWELVERPANKKIIGVKWYGIDYLDTFAPVAKLDTIRLLIALAAHMQWKIHQLDAKSAFLNGFLEEEIYVEQPQGFKVADKEEMVYRLKKALYGLKQAPKTWYSRIDGYLASLEFERSSSEPTLYVKKKGAKTQLIVSLYVEDLLVIGGDQAMLVDFKAKMQQVFEMSDLGQMS